MANSKISFIAISFFFLTFTQNEVFSQNTNDALRLAYSGLGSSARALGMGNSYIGLSDDASASFFNPAGFGLIKKIELSGGLSYSNYKNETDFFNQKSNYSNSNTTLNRLSFVFPLPTTRGSLVFGLSYHNTADLTSALKFDGLNNQNSWINYFSLRNNNIPYDLYLSYPLRDNQAQYIKDTTIIGGGLNQSGSILGSGNVNNWTFSGAIEVYKNLFVGLNLNVHTGTYESNNDYYEDDLNKLYQGETSPGETETIDFQTFHLNRLLKWDLEGWNAKFGMLYQFNKNARFGLTVQMPKKFNIKEKFIVNGSSDYASQSFYLNQDDYSDEVEYSIETPFELAGGISVNIQGLIFSAEATLLDYSQIEFANKAGLGEDYVAEVNKDVKDLLGAVVNYNLGIEYTLPEIGLRLRGGFFVKPSAYKEDDQSFDKKYFTAGLGFLAEEAVSIDIGFAHGWWKDFGDNYGTNLSRTIQDISVNNLIVTTTFRF
ncbi:MAG: outer membrane protein transport protein [Ignavibacteriaceae bacterium]|nr:outer membrane protein transport protein [Ignavibacteriaceae bacterium]